jgi:hypothetical protein
MVTDRLRVLSAQQMRASSERSKPGSFVAIVGPPGQGIELRGHDF